MDRHNETFDGILKRIFGPAAELAGSIGSVQQPGEVQVVLAGRVIGRGPTFATALQTAQATAAGETAANQSTGV